MLYRLCEALRSPVEKRSFCFHLASCITALAEPEERQSPLKEALWWYHRDGGRDAFLDRTASEH